MAALRGKRGKTASIAPKETTDSEQLEQQEDSRPIDGAEWDLSEFGSKQDLVLRAIEGEILPRLLIAQSQERRDVKTAAKGLTAVDKETISSFARLLSEADMQAIDAYIESHLAKGMSVDSLLLDLFAPTARELGDMWLRDECSFTEVTIGLCALECQLMRHTEREQPISMVPDENRVALFSPVPGEQHVFGLLIVKELFRRAGWAVSAPSEAQEDALLDAVQENWFSIIGLTVSCAEAARRCASLIPRLRLASQNPELVVVVGGYCFERAEEEQELIGADLVVNDGPTALVEIERLIDQREDNGLVH